MKFIEALEEERKDMTKKDFVKSIGVSPSTYNVWLKGTYSPRADTRNEVADALGWSDEKRMAHMPEVSKKWTPLVRSIVRHMQYLKFSYEDLAIVLNIDRTTIDYWQREGVPRNMRALAQSFLKIDKEEADSLLALNMKKTEKKFFEKPVKKPKGKRHKLNIPLIRKIEDKYGGSMGNCPDDEPMLKQLHKELGVNFEPSVYDIQKVEDLRIKRNLKRNEVSRGIGRADSWYANFYGIGRMNKERVEDLAKFFGVSVEYFKKEEGVI